MIPIAYHMAEASQPLRRHRDWLAEVRTKTPAWGAIIVIATVVAYPIAEAGIGVFRWWFNLP